MKRQTNKETYRILCEQKDIPLFQQAWWMDAVCTDGKDWDVLFHSHEGIIVAALPFHILTKYGLRFIIQPQLTPFSGIWFDQIDDLSDDRNFSWKNEICNKLIEQLDDLKPHYFEQNFHYSFTDWQPFYWKHFLQTTHYTYIINDISDPVKVFDAFDRSKKGHITNAEKVLHVDYSMSAVDFYSLHKQSLADRKRTISYSLNLFMSIYDSATNRNQSQIVCVKDVSGNVHAALFIVWDKYSAYNLISIIPTAYKASGGSSLVVWEAIKLMSQKTKMFDFEGSMIEGVAKSFQQFGTKQTAYFKISKSYSIIGSLLMTVHRRLKNLSMVS